MIIGIELKGHWAEEIEDRMAHEEVHDARFRFVIVSPYIGIYVIENTGSSQRTEQTSRDSVALFSYHRTAN
jgi:hypothetical protein